MYKYYAYILRISFKMCKYFSLVIYPDGLTGNVPLSFPWRTFGGLEQCALSISLINSLRKLGISDNNFWIKSSWLPFLPLLQKSYKLRLFPLNLFYRSTISTFDFNYSCSMVVCVKFIDFYEIPLIYLLWAKRCERQCDWRQRHWKQSLPLKH